MDLEDIFLARFAELTPDGLFTVVGGGISRINAASFPWTWGLMFLLARYRLTMEEAHRRHMLSIERETPNGQLEHVGPAFPMVNLPATPEIGPDGKFGFSLDYCMTNLVFSEPGVYKYRLKMDGKDVGEVKVLLAGPS